MEVALRRGSAIALQRGDRARLRLKKKKKKVGDCSRLNDTGSSRIHGSEFIWEVLEIPVGW